MKVKKFTKKDRYGNMMSFEFDIDSELNGQQVPPMGMGIPRYKAVGGMESNHPGEPKGSDTVPAWLTPGEFVVNKEATDIYGPIIKQMNDHGRAIQNGQKPPPQYANKGKEIQGKYQDNVKRIYTHLKNKWKLNNNQIGAILGQIGHETGGTFDYQMLEKNVDASVQGQGLFQNTPGKNRMLEPYLKYLNKNELTNSPESQIDFFMDSFMTKGAVPREDNPNTKTNEASPWYHGSKKADRMRNALMNKDLRVNVGWKDKDPSLVGELTRFINVPGESLKSRDNWTTAGLQWANEHGMKVIPGLPKDGNAGNLYEAGATTSFPGEEKYEKEITWTDRAGQIKDKFMDNLRWNEGGAIPPAYLEHGGWHWGDPSTWSWDHWNYDPAKDITKTIPDYKVSPGNEWTDEPYGNPLPESWKGYAEEHDKMWGGRPDDNMNIPISPWEGKTGEGSGYETNDVPSLNVPSKYGDIITYKLGDGASQIYKKNSQTGMYEDQYGKPMDLKVQKEFDIAQSGKWDEEYGGSNPFSNYENELGGKNVITINDKIKELENKAAEEVKEKGSVSNKTINDISKKQGELIQNKKHEEKNIIKKNKEINSLEDDLKSKYEAAKEQALSVGVMEFPTFEEWSKKFEADKWKNIQEHKDNKNVLQQVDESNKTTNKKEIANKLITDTDTIAKKKVDTKQHSESTITKTGEEGTNDSQKKTAMGMIQSFLGPLFDTQELKRMAIIYLGSRLLGYDHGGSLQYAAKSYLGRVDKKDAAIQKWVLENYGKVTPKSLQKFLVTRNPGDLIPIGTRAVDTGNTAIHYGPDGSEVRAREFKRKLPDGQTETEWYLMDGKTKLPKNFVKAGSAGLDRTESSPAWDKEVARKSKNVLEVLKDVNTRFNLKKKAKEGEKNEYYFEEYMPSGDVHRIAEWAHANNLDMVALKGRVGPAFKKMIQDKKADKAIAGNSILPYLKEELIKFDLGKTNSGQHFYKQGDYKTSQANIIQINEKVKELFPTDQNKGWNKLWSIYSKNKLNNPTSKYHNLPYQKIFNDSDMMKNNGGKTPFAVFVETFYYESKKPKD